MSLGRKDPRRFHSRRSFLLPLRGLFQAHTLKTPCCGDVGQVLDVIFYSDLPLPSTLAGFPQLHSRRKTSLASLSVYNNCSHVAQTSACEITNAPEARLPLAVGLKSRKLDEFCLSFFPLQNASENVCECQSSAAEDVRGVFVGGVCCDSDSLIISCATWVTARPVEAIQVQPAFTRWAFPHSFLFHSLFSSLNLCAVRSAPTFALQQGPAHPSPPLSLPSSLPETQALHHSGLPDPQNKSVG